MSYAARLVYNPRPVETVRPLEIGAARFHTSFICLAPRDWTGAIVLAQLFKLYEFENCGWKEETTEIECVGSDLDCRRWRVTKR